MLKFKKASIINITVAVFTSLTFLLIYPLPAHAAYTCTGGGDHGNTSWDPATDCPGGIAGVHTGITTLTINNAETATVLAYNGTSFGTVSITANSATITGTLTANGSGNLGSTSSASPGGGSGGGTSTSGTGGAGGGGYGGAGGSGSFGGVAGGGTYGLIANPTSMGSGGGFGNSTNGYSGGGAITLNVSGTVTVNGTISANGNGGAFGGCGSGGSINITSGTFAGSGTITANGGNGGTGATQNGNGGGGRIYISYSSSNTFSGAAPAANAGTGGGGGISGSSLLVDSTNNDLYINTSQTWYTSASEQSFTYRNVNVASSVTWSQVGYYTSNTNGVGFTFNTTNFTLNSGAIIDMNGNGYAGATATNTAGSGPGPGQPGGTNGGSGGGYGGIGGTGAFGSGAVGGTHYGSITAPVDLGSGGGNGNSGTGGSGGGAIKIINSNTITVTGTIRANGANGGGGASGAGGSGGSIYITTGTLAGSGAITANGGNGGNGSTNSGNGAGGRIYISYSSSNTYSGSTPTVAPGTGGTGGDYGSNLLVDSTNNDLYINTSQSWYATGTFSSVTYRNIIVSNSSTWLQGGYYTNNTNGVGFTINATNFTLNSGSIIDMNGKGYAGGTGTSVNGSGSGGGTGSAGAYAGGGGYGGAGGASSSGAAGGSTYGSSTAPIDLGSGGGGSTQGAGGAGGGAITLVVSATATINGTIRANGSASVGQNAGPGSGGSIYITAGTLTGTPTMTVTGGNGHTDCCGNGNSGNGGGGRIALYYTITDSLGFAYLASSNVGINGGNGANGTIVLAASGTPAISALAQDKVDCSTSISSGSKLDGSIGVCFKATGSDTLNPDTLTLQIEIEPNGTSFTNSATTSTSSSYSGGSLNFSWTYSNLTLGTSYHWQARIVDAEGFTSSWSQMGGSPDFIDANSTPTRVGSSFTDTDTDFNTGTYSSTAINGTSGAAVVGLTGNINGINNSGLYRAITINNTGNSNTLTNYQVSLTLNTASLISAGKMRSDCGDIRFTDSDQVTAINNYWIENCNNASTKIWVKVPSISASSNKTIYLYYGNFANTSLSSVSNTFIDDITGAYTAYPMEEASGTTTVADKTANAANGTSQSSTDITSGNFFNARSFNGTSDYITLPSGFSNLRSGFSVALWAYPTAANSWARFIDLSNGSSSDNILFARNSTSTNLSYQVYNGGNGGTTVTATGAIALNAWQHFVATEDGSGNVVLYKNGASVATGTTTVPQNILRSTDYIGKSPFSGDGLFQGNMDELVIYNKVLTSTQVSEIYNNYGYFTSNDTGHELVREFSSPEPAASVGSENGPSASSGTWTSVSGSSALKLYQNSAWGDGTSGSIAFYASLYDLSTADAIQFQMRTASSSAALASASYTTIGTANGGTIFVATKSDLDGLSISPLPYVQVKATYTTGGSSPLIDLMGIYYVPTTPSTNVTVDTDTDFNKGAYSGTTLNGTGTGANVSLQPVSPTGDLYSRAITIDNTSNASTLTNYQVSITLDTATPITGGKMRSDCGDIRFLDSDKITAINNFWVENCNNASTKIWVKVPSIAASSTKTIYLYYGNSTDSTLSSTTNTFIDDISGVIAAWNLDESSGTSIADSTGNGHTGTSTNATIVSGKFGNALNFSNSSTSFASTTNEANFPFGTSARSVCLWAKTPEVNTGFNLAFSMGSGNNEQTFGIGRNGTTLYGFGWNDDISSNNFWAAGTWEQVCFTFDGAKASLYGNGSQLVAPTAKPSWNTVDSGTTYIGKSEASSFPDPWDGAVDQVRIYNSALTSSQISDIYNNYGYVTSNYSGHELIRQYNSPEPVASVGSETTANSGTWISDNAANALNLAGNTGWGDGINSTSIGFFMSGTSLSPSQTIKVEIRTASSAGGLSSASYITLGTVTDGVSLILSKSDMDNLSITPAAYVQLRSTLSQTTGTSPVLDRMILYYGTTQPPNSPTSLQQYRNDGTTTITNNTWTSDGITNNVVFKFSMSSPNASDTLTPKIELVTNSTTFTGTPNYSGTAVAYSGTAVTGTVTVTGLVSCTGYKWQAFVANSAGTSSPTVFNVTTPNVSVQNTGPNAGSVFDGSADGTEVATTTSITQMDSNWTGFSDSCSGLAATPYTVAIGTTSGGTNVSGYTSTGVTLNNPNPYNTYSVSNLPIHTGQTYYVSIKALNNAGVTTVITTSGQYVAPTLTFSIDTNSVDMGHWNPGNSYSSTATNTLSILTNAYNGYSIYAFAGNHLHLVQAPSTTIQDFSGGTYSSPGAWSAGLYGFGYTTSCTTINGSNPFASGTKYAPFNHTGPGDIVAQNTTAITGATYTGTPDSQTITYKTAVPANQSDGSYQANISYTIVTTL